MMTALSRAGALAVLMTLAACGGSDGSAVSAPPALRPGDSIGVVATDVCVPISRLAECVDETKRDIVVSRFDALPHGT